VRGAGPVIHHARTPDHAPPRPVAPNWARPERRRRAVASAGPGRSHAQRAMTYRNQGAERSWGDATPVVPSRTAMCWVPAQYPPASCRCQKNLRSASGTTTNGMNQETETPPPPNSQAKLAVRACARRCVDPRRPTFCLIFRILIFTAVQPGRRVARPEIASCVAVCPGAAISCCSAYACCKAQRRWRKTGGRWECRAKGGCLHGRRADA